MATIAPRLRRTQPERKIDFIDLISEVRVDFDETENYQDDYLDSRVTVWNNVTDKILKMKNLKKVFFTRKSFSNIPNMKKKIENVRAICESKKIKFDCLITPARVYSVEKQKSWTDFLHRI